MKIGKNIFYFFILSFVNHSINLSAQNFSYSAALGNNLYEKAKIIGRVKDNIVVWNYNSSDRHSTKKSELLVYNNKLQLLNTVSFKHIATEILSIDFINEGNSFAAILQYPVNKSVCYKLISFDAYGNITDTQTITQGSDYEMIKSENDKSFVLIKTDTTKMRNAIALQYHFIKNDSLVHSGKYILPFDTLYSSLGKAILDDDKLVFSVTDSIINGTKLTVFKLDLKNDSSINTIRILNNGQLNWTNGLISKSSNYYLLTSQWSNYDSNQTGTKIFLWRLNKDLTDKNADTVLSGNDSMNICLKQIYYYKLNLSVLKNNTLDIFITADEIKDKPIYLYSPEYGLLNNVNRYSHNFTIPPENEQNGDGYYGVLDDPKVLSYLALYYTRYTASGQVIKPQPQPATFTILNIDAQNNLKWSQCFNASGITDISYLIKHSISINTPNALHIIYSVPVDKKNKQSLTDIVLHADGSYTTHPIISMNLKYSYMVEEGMQLDENSVLFPCVIKGKRAFAEYTVK